jgi:hypothetical protein
VPSSFLSSILRSWIRIVPTLLGGGVASAHSNVFESRKPSILNLIYCLTSNMNLKRSVEKYSSGQSSRYEPPNIVHSCIRTGLATACFTSEWSGNVMPVPKTFAVMGNTRSVTM